MVANTDLFNQEVLNGLLTEDEAVYGGNLCYILGNCSIKPEKEGILLCEGSRKRQDIERAVVRRHHTHY